MVPDNSNLAVAVARLEKQLRVLRLALGAVVLAVGGMALTAWTLPQEQTVTAERFMVLDTDGIPRGMFGVLADGASVGMMFSDLAGTARMEVGVNPDGSPRVALMDDQQRLRLEVGMNDDGSARIVLADPTEIARAALSVTNEGSAQMSFIGADGTTRRAVIGTLEDSQAVLLLYDDAGEVVTQLPAGVSLPMADTTGQR